MPAVSPQKSARFCSFSAYRGSSLTQNEALLRQFSTRSFRDGHVHVAADRRLTVRIPVRFGWLVGAFGRVGSLRVGNLASHDPRSGLIARLTGRVPAEAESDDTPAGQVAIDSRRRLKANSNVHAVAAEFRDPA